MFGVVKDVRERPSSKLMDYKFIFIQRQNL